MAEKKNMTVNPAFTGRNVPLSEISQASGIGEGTLRRGLRDGFFDFGYAIRSEKGEQYRFYCPDRLVYLKLGYFNPEPDKQDNEPEKSAAD